MNTVRIKFLDLANSLFVKTTAEGKAIARFLERHFNRTNLNKRNEQLIFAVIE